ncbi:MAG: DUF1232 domain-containing protein [Myxococcales bacterium]|nr:DUF1232 domain-containing protein [Myxococcales bacterium]MCB9582999.1 DUF1232 domain-containing protein [Polyangiaceae bacterium]
MNDLDTRCLEAFPGWLSTLGEDARALAELVESETGTEGARRQLVQALNYLFKSLDLIPDGIEDLGFVDDAFVFRTATAEAAKLDQELAGSDATVKRLTEDAALIREFLADDAPRLETHVAGLGSSSARGRTADDVLGDAEVRATFVREVKSWADAYQAPTFTRDPKTLVKLRSFLTAKLPK